MDIEKPEPKVKTIPATEETGKSEHTIKAMENATERPAQTPTELLCAVLGMLDSGQVAADVAMVVLIKREAGQRIGFRFECGMGIEDVIAALEIELRRRLEKIHQQTPKLVQ